MCVTRRDTPPLLPWANAAGAGRRTPTCDRVSWSPQEHITQVPREVPATCVHYSVRPGPNVPRFLRMDRGGTLLDSHAFARIPRDSSIGSIS